MQNELNNYRDMLTRFVGLQQNLIRVFENSVTVSPPSVNLLKEFNLEKVIREKAMISQVLEHWPPNVPILPLHIWIKPNKGVLHLNEQNWFYKLHGTLEILFIELPSDVRGDMFAKMDFDIKNLYCLHDDVIPGLTVESFYFREKKIYFTTRTVQLFANSAGFHVDDAFHVKCLAALVREKFIQIVANSIQGEITYAL